MQFTQVLPAIRRPINSSLILTMSDNFFSNTIRIRLYAESQPSLASLPALAALPALLFGCLSLILLRTQRTYHSITHISMSTTHRLIYSVWFVYQMYPSFHKIILMRPMTPWPPPRCHRVTHHKTNERHRALCAPYASLCLTRAHSQPCLFLCLVYFLLFYLTVRSLCLA